MPNWTDDEGYNWFSKLECPRCLRRLDEDARGEMSDHECIVANHPTAEVRARRVAGRMGR